MTQPPLITTVIPTYKRPNFLPRAITSAIEQNSNARLICVYDNCSQDATASIVKTLQQTDDRIKYHCHSTNIGHMGNFEYALSNIQTEYFSILADDDYLLPGFYDLALRELEENPEAMFWAGTTLNVGENNIIWDARIQLWPRDGLYTPPEGLIQMLNGLAPNWTGIVFRKEILDTLGMPDWNLLGPSDLDFILRIAANHPFIIRKIPVAAYALNSASFSATEPLSSFWPGWKKMISNLESELTSYSTPDRLRVMKSINKDAQRMLFRRGASGLANTRLDYSKACSDTLVLEYNQKYQATLINILISICKKSDLAQKLYIYFYHLIEKRIVATRRRTHARYKHLLKPLDTL